MPIYLTAMAVNDNSNSRYPILTLSETSQEEFIHFWSRQYDYPRFEIYTENIGKPLTPERIIRLFEWKNGTPFSAKKKKSIEQNYLTKQEEPPIDGSDEELRAFLQKPGGAIWRIFWLHCHGPSKYPIYDRNVHRAMAKIERWETQLEIPNYKPRVVESYLKNYRPFLKKFSSFKLQTIDHALMAYGQFLKLYPNFEHSKQGGA